MSSSIVAIIPAYNEEKTIGHVVAQLVFSRVFKRVIVVSDGSSDATALRAREAGAEVFELHVNQGKGEAVRHGIDQVTSTHIALFDADLVGLTVEHVHQLVDPVLTGVYDMTVGLRDRGAWFMPIARHLPYIGGERVCARERIACLPARFFHGFRLEAGLAVLHRKQRARVVGIPLTGLTIRRKIQKSGILHGIQGYIHMSAQVVIAYLDAWMRI